MTIFIAALFRAFARRFPRAGNGLDRAVTYLLIAIAVVAVIGLILTTLINGSYTDGTDP